MAFSLVSRSVSQIGDVLQLVSGAVYLYPCSVIRNLHGENACLLSSGIFSGEASRLNWPGIMRSTRYSTTTR